MGFIKKPDGDTRHVRVLRPLHVNCRATIRAEGLVKTSFRFCGASKLSRLTAYLDLIMRIVSGLTDGRP